MTTIEGMLKEFNLNQWQKEDLRMFMRDGTKPILEGFEKVLGEKWGCGNCQFIRYVSCRDKTMAYVCPWIWNSEPLTSYSGCNIFEISDKTKAEIKLEDYWIILSKIDIHPRYKIGVLRTHKYHTCKNGYIMHASTKRSDLELIL